MSIDLKEAADWSNTTVEEGVIKNVKLLGEKSKNGNVYPLAVRRKAHRLFEGIVVNLNHPSRQNKGEDRSVESRIGKLVNVREGQGGSYADLHFLKSHPMAPALIEAAQRMPELYGLSINGRGTVKNSKGENIVESIESLRSVDLVADPATVKGLFESAEPTSKSSDMIIGELIAALVSEGKEDMVKDVIKLKKKMGGGKDEGEESEEVTAEEVPAEESVNEELEALRLEKSCRSLLESNNLPVDAVLVESLMSMKDEGIRTKFVAWHRKKALVKTPKSVEPVRTEIKESTDWASVLRSR